MVNSGLTYQLTRFSRFLLVSLIMDAILADPTIHQRRKTLLRMTNGVGLGDAYGTTLNRIRKQIGNRMKLGVEALMWILCSERLLKVEELCNALGVEAGTTDFNPDNVPSIQTLVSCTLGLITIDEQSSTVRLVHFTLQEYLSAHPNLFITPHSKMAEICLTYLNFQSVCQFPTTASATLPTAPFLHYASCYWGSHARKEMAENVKRLALQLLRRDANHISAGVLLCEESVDFWSWLDRHRGIPPDLRGFSGLHCIAYMGIAEIAIDMVNMKRWDLNGRDSKGATPLIWAVKYANSRIVKLLLEQRDVDPTLSDQQGLTPLVHAAIAGRRDLVRMLLERGDVNPNSPDQCGQTPLSNAAQYGYEGVVELLLGRQDVDPNPSDKCGQTPLSNAARSGHEGVVKLLLERRDLNPNSSDKYGQTPLSNAARSGHESVVKLLLGRQDVNPNTSDKWGQTPLLNATRSGYRHVVELLLERGDVNPNPSDMHGLTPLLTAAGSGSEGIVKLLLERGHVNPDSSDEYGGTPLAYAAGSGREGVVKLPFGDRIAGYNCI